jgi:two-component system sensor histidine kinase KdpD
LFAIFGNDALEYRAGGESVLQRRPVRVLIGLCGVLVVTFLGYKVIPVNATTVGFAYLLIILVLASTWGFLEAALASVLATLVFNFFFLPPVGTFTIADPQNWVALSSFLATSLIASRLSAKARARTSEAIERQRDLERLYAFSRAMLQIETGTPFATQLLERLVQVFDLQAAALYERDSSEVSCVGIASPEGVQNILQNAAVLGGSSPQEEPPYMIVTVSRGSKPVASMALRGATMPRSVLQGVANLVAIGLERARAQDLAQQVEAARQSEQLRTTLIDAMAHEFKTPLTLIRAATTSLLANPEIPASNRTEQLAIANEEAEHLQELIDDAIEMARLDTTHIEIHPELASLEETLREVRTSMQTEIDERPVQIAINGALPAVPFDKRLLKLAIRQLLDNALKYTPAETPVQLGAQMKDGVLTIDVTDYGNGIPDEERNRIFERFYRCPAVKGQIPGSGLGLSIAEGIVRAHNGELTVSSHPGQTTFRITLPFIRQEVA